MFDIPRLGASLYVPATRPDLCAIAAGEKLAAVRSVIFCLEDAVAEAELPQAFANLQAALRLLHPRTGFLRFVRVRNPEILSAVLQLDGISALDGFVLPKVTEDNMDAYMRQIPASSPWWIMPTLETREVFQDSAMQSFAAYMDRAIWRERILSLRIGGNDLLALLRIRRPRGKTIYETPLGHVIARLATTFIPYGFALSAPVFEHFDDQETLAREVESDLNHGLIGKTAVHPDQVSLIEQHYRVSQEDLEVAQQILRPDAPGVFRLHQSMCEPATHRPWAQSMVEAARLFGCC